MEIIKDLIEERSDVACETRTIADEKPFLWQHTVRDYGQHGRHSPSLGDCEFSSHNICDSRSS
jgi:hypothetical protein